MKKKILSDIDIQLYLAKALPWYKRFFILISSILNTNIQEQIENAESANRVFTSTEQRKLQYKLFGTTVENESPSKHFPPFFRPAISFALICVLAIPLYFHMNQEQPHYTAKGSGLGVNIYKKDVDYTLLADKNIILSKNDTIQILPVGKTKQYCMLFALDSLNTLQQIFPETENRLGLIDSNTLPPSLVFDGFKTQLISITSSRNLSSDSLSTIIKPFIIATIEQKPVSHIVDNIYIQQFNIEPEVTNE